MKTIIVEHYVCIQGMFKSSGAKAVFTKTEINILFSKNSSFVLSSFPLVEVPQKILS